DIILQNTTINAPCLRSMILDNVFCTNSICVPSRASILTGKYSHQNGIYTLSEALSPDSMNIAKVLQNHAYETAIIGKWHLKEQPAGFDYFNVLPGQGRYQNPILKDKESWEDGGIVHEGFSADVIGDLSVEWLKDRNPSKPFFLMTHFKATHEPFDCAERHQDLYTDVELPMPESLQDAENTRTFAGQELEILGNRWLVGSQKLKEGGTSTYPDLPFSLQEGLDSIAIREKIYQKFVKDFIRSGAAIDDNIGKLLDYLEAAGLEESTVVIYTSDQGYFLGEHGFFDKRMMYEEALRMPFIIRYPKEITANSRNKDIILNIDFPSLFADYAGISTPDFLEGRSFRNNLKGKTPKDWRTSMYYRYWLHQSNSPAHFGIRNERYKLIFFYGQPLGMPDAHRETTAPSWEFFDLQNDPQERRNIYYNTDYHETINEMKKDLLELKLQLGDTTDYKQPVMQRIFQEHWN
ncbi:MAG: sulfatase/phosphatase domain-containing protein, partial [Bacteroidota bacterium]